MDFPVLVKERIVQKKSIANFEQALEILGQPLIEGGYITESYLRGITDSLGKNGPYFVIAPKIALPHAQAQGNVLALGLSVLRVEQAVTIFDREVNLFIMLAAPDGDAHLKILSRLVDVMDTEEKQEFLLACPVEALQDILLQDWK
ncbi:L-ascorbate-specific enzyme IIA component of PTS [Erysipelotrichaceae bacterium]|nr:L-ascorbate-specific enzyme IIA component of PTS [Erysipelotrichaceae bacterium]